MRIQQLKYKHENRKMIKVQKVLIDTYPCLYDKQRNITSHLSSGDG